MYIHLVKNTGPSSLNVRISNFEFIGKIFYEIHYKMIEMLSELGSYFLVLCPMSTSHANKSPSKGLRMSINSMVK
jgi:hypothetical protein